MSNIQQDSVRPISERRNALRMFGFAALSISALLPHRQAEAKEASADELRSSSGASQLSQLTQRLAAAPRRRDFDAVPFMITDRRYWDHEAAAEVLAYQPKSRQLWENTDIAGPWPGLMREAMNGQVFGNHNENYLAVSATHGLAHLSLFTQPMWDKYDLATIAGPKFPKNTLIVEKAGVSKSDSNEDMNGFYGPNNNNVVSLQRRGAVFVACHDSIHAIARMVSASNAQYGTPDKIAADLTNNLIDGAVLVPSVVSFMVDLQDKGFTYAKGG